MPPTKTLCRTCSAPVFWVETETGKKMPVDAVPVADGNIIFIDKKAHVLSKDEVPPPDAKRWVSHFSTCPQSKHHRRKK